MMKKTHIGILTFTALSVILTSIWLYASGGFQSTFVYDEEFYSNLINEDETSKDIEEWILATFPDWRVKELGGDFVYSSAPGDISFIGPKDLSFLPFGGRGMRVELFVDLERNIEAIFIGHSDRTGIIYTRDGDFEAAFPIGSALLKKRGNLAVFSVGAD